MKKLLLYILLFLSVSSFAQFEEQFSDGGFNVNPHWDTLGSKFIVVNQVLNLQATQNAGKAAIVTADNLAESAEWSLYVRLGFQPSEEDNVKIVLMSDEMDIRADFNGYFVKIGQNDTNDALDFYRKDGNAESLIKKMLVGNFQNGADGYLKVIKNNLGKWVFLWKNTNETEYVRIDSTQELTYNTSSYFGMLCTHTLASKDSFWFDDVRAIQLPLVVEDLIPPFVIRAELINSKQIDVYFDETLDVVSSQTIFNYNLTTFGNPTTVTLDISNKRLVHLYFADRFSSNTNYTLTTNNVKDSAGNAMTVQSTNIIRTPYYALPGDILINEIMIKPTTTLGLPDKQYVEIRNKSNETIRLKNFTLNSSVLYDGYILPDGYAILCAESDTNSLKPFGNTIGVNNWNTLLFSGNATIRTDDEILLDSLPYTDDTYQDPIKQSGGWSLELLADGYNGDCAKELFWAAAIDVNGGTPGEINRNVSSVYVNATYSLLTNNTIEVDFIKPMDRTEVQTISNYSFNNGISVQSVQLLNAYATKVKLTLNSTLQENVIYSFIIKEFSGCIKYIHAADTFEIAITDVPESGELIINEILFQPNANGEQFVELYNKTNKLFKLKDIKITQANIVTGSDIQILELTTTRGYIFPNDYSVLTKNKNIVKTQYTNAVLSKLYNVNLPTYDEAEDIVVIKNTNDVVIDKLQYHVNWHFPLLNTTRGVSLEKSGFGLPQVKRYWHSATPDVNFATPGYLNSENTYQLQGDVHIIPEVFSPDGDGIDDEAKITYSFDNDGSVVNVYLYNADGRLANHLIKDIAIPKEGVFIWNGDDENGDKKDVGIYFLVFERKNPDGEKIFYKRKCVLAAKLN